MGELARRRRVPGVEALHRPLVAVNTIAYQGSHDLLLSHLNETLEDEAGIEHEPTEAEQARERRNAEHWQTYHDMQATITRLDAENTELRRKLEQP